MTFNADFEEVLCAWAWWDCPRSGIALVNGTPHRFDCQFSSDLDDYPAAFQLWPIDQAQLDTELSLWARWVDWRGHFDVGDATDPWEHQPGFAELRERLTACAVVPAHATLAGPEWKLDRNRTFAGRVPKHFVRWRRTE